MNGHIYNFHKEGAPERASTVVSLNTVVSLIGGMGVWGMTRWNQAKPSYPSLAVSIWLQCGAA